MEAERGDHESQQEVKEELTRYPDPESHSESCRLNSTDELHLLTLANDFQLQLSILYPDRKPLLLCPANQYGVQKFVCSTLRPSPACQLELYFWEGCASFVSDYLRAEPLDPPTELVLRGGGFKMLKPPEILTELFVLAGGYLHGFFLTSPRSISSPSLVLQRQSASCFESSILLCCLLLGDNYDAYCVSGYAVQEMCKGDQSWKPCPLQENTQQDEKVSLEQEIKQGSETKYSVKPPRELKSRYLTQLEEKLKREDEAVKQSLLPHVPLDPLWGLRVHCWVLVLSGSNGIQQNFFIDPLSGNRFPTDSDKFLGIESLWNHKNYYFNIKDCSRGCAEVLFDLSDRMLWEPLFPLEERRGLTLEEEEQHQIGVCKKALELPVLTMPRPWISPITGLLSDRVLQTLPGGYKEILYRKSKLENFDPWSRIQGLARRWTTYRDENHSEVTEVKEWFVKRSDFLQTRGVNMADGWVTERFTPTESPLLLFKYRPCTSPTEVLTEFSTLQCFNVRRILLTPCQMLETFEDRDDFLYQRRVFFESQMSKLEFNEFTIVKVEEHFHRNESKPADEDMAERRYLQVQNRIEVTYHPMEGRFIPPEMIFKNVDQPNQQVDPAKKSPTPCTESQTLEALQNNLKVLVHQVKTSLEEVERTLILRGKMEQNEEENEKGKNRGPSADGQRTRKRLQNKSTGISVRLFSKSSESPTVKI